MGEVLPPKDVDKVYPWDKRRFMIYVVIAFCMGCVAYILWKGYDTRVAETVVECAFFVIASMCGSFVFGATWQDISHMRLFSAGKDG